jgi:1-acyl-sn-glycerol-3-phosphate acyltransferase
MFYRIWWFLLPPIIRVYWRVRSRGGRNVPRHGSAILASNHQSGVDPGVICTVLRRRIWWLAKIDLVRSKKTAWFFRSVSVIPIDRDAPQQASIDAAVGVLRRGKLFALFPEGTRSPDGRIYRGFTGVARIAHASGAPVIPVGVKNTIRAVPKGKLVPRPVKCEVRFGSPMRFEIRFGEDEAAAHRRFTDEVMAAISRLTGAERVDRYSREPVRRAS